jgi:hypothetical protein
MSKNIDTIATALVDAYTDGGHCTGWEELDAIGEVLNSGDGSVAGFVSVLRDTPTSRWNAWASELGVTRLSAVQVKRVIDEVANILAPIASIPVVTVVGHGVERDTSSRRFVDGTPPRVSPEKDPDRLAFAAALLRDGFRFDMTYGEWVSADGNVIGRVSSDNTGVWLSKPLPSTEKIRFTPRQKG